MFFFSEKSRRWGKGLMVEGDSPWEHRLTVKLVLLVVMVLVAGSSCLAQSLNDATAFLDNVENEVMRIAAKATENFNNTCGILFPIWKSSFQSFLKPGTSTLAGLIVCAF